jgi:histone-lysine N-methyltransferase SETMAR
MLCVWWDLKGILHHKLLNPNEIIMADRYCAETENLKLGTDAKRLALANRKGVIFHQDIARPRTAITTQEKLGS